MFNLSDKELDRLSRKAADAYEVETNASSWDALEQQLDKELGAAPNPSVPLARSFRFPFAYTSLIILLVGTGYFLLKSGKNSSIANKKDYSLTNKQKVADNKYADDSLKETPAISAEENKMIVAPQANKSTTNDKTPAANISSAEKTSADLNKKEAKEKSRSVDLKTNSTSQKNNENKNEVVANNKKNNSISDNLLTEKYKDKSYDNSIKSFSYSTKKPLSSKTIGGKNKAFNVNYKNKTDKRIGEVTSDEIAINHLESTGNSSNNKPVLNPSEEEHLKYASTSGAKQLTKHSFIVINDAALRDETAKNNAQHIINLNKKNSRSLNTNRSLQIGVSFAPDFSEVKHAYDNTRLGRSIGITLGYQLLKRLSINTGLIYSHKYYQVDDEDFHLPRNFAPNNVHIDFVNGSSKMIEIPINLRYDVSIEGNTIFFINGGLSSYLMQKQDYSYYCRNNVGYGAFWVKQSYDGQQNFWFSMVNFSAGFETNISNTISFQVDPYIKLPLKGVGIGNIKLNSYGINLAIKFSPVLKRSRH